MENHVGSNGVISQDEIPAVVKDVLPADPFDLLNLSRLIAAQAFTARIHTLEAEAGRLKGSLGDSQSSINALEAKVADLELTLKEANEKREAAEEEQAKLTGEKTALVAMVKKLNRDVAKLETFRRTLMQQLKDENDDEPASEVGMAESAAGRKPPVPESSVTSDSSASTNKTQPDVSASLAAGVAGPGAGTALRVDHVARSTAAAGSATVASAMDHAGPGEDAGRSNITTGGQAAAASTTGSSSSVSASLRNLRTPQRTPSMTPSLFSPAFTPSATPPHGSTAASPRSRTEARAPRVDGKEFFRRARNRLSYEQFSLFLANIKELNAHRKTREFLFLANIKELNAHRKTREVSGALRGFQVPCGMAWHALL
ncbi:unnamed protein product [Closterium sp. Naga37s-1]|nr:unnamed protein product [Closterium sp. Naga37s-1]CAI5525325.1 unnamed protein product [Closterium sp. Naga37s-1]